MQKSKLKHADKGVFDRVHRLFIPAGRAFNQAKYDEAKKWFDAHPGAYQDALGKIDALKQSGKKYCSTPLLQSFFLDSGVKFPPNLVTYLKWRIVYDRPKLHLFQFQGKERERHCPHCGGAL